jgi:hypothetical protein
VAERNADTAAMAAAMAVRLIVRGVLGQATLARQAHGRPSSLLKERMRVSPPR